MTNDGRSIFGVQFVLFDHTAESEVSSAMLGVRPVTGDFCLDCSGINHFRDYSQQLQSRLLSSALCLATT